MSFVLQRGGRGCFCCTAATPTRGCAGFDEDDDGRYWPAGRCARCGGDGVVPFPVAAVAPGCVHCDGRGYHREESAVFGTTYRVNCQACRGTGVEPARRAA